MSNYVYCDSYGESPSAPWHIRRWAEVPHMTTLCGKRVKSDMETPVTALCLGVSLESCPDLVCQVCASKYLKTQEPRP
jgi:hypothetical protein